MVLKVPNLGSTKRLSHSFQSFCFDTIGAGTLNGHGPPILGTCKLEVLGSKFQLTANDTDDFHGIPVLLVDGKMEVFPSKLVPSDLSFWSIASALALKFVLTWRHSNGDGPILLRVGLQSRGEDAAYS